MQSYKKIHDDISNAGQAMIMVVPVIVLMQLVDWVGQGGGGQGVEEPMGGERP